MADVAYFMPENLRLPAAARGQAALTGGIRWCRAIPRRCTAAGVSVRGITVPEWEVPEEEWEDYVIEEPRHMNLNFASEQHGARPSLR